MTPADKDDSELESEGNRIISTARTGIDWRKTKEESRERKRKWTEEKIIKGLEKKKKLEKMKEKEAEEEEIEKEKKIEKGRPYTVSMAIPGSIMENAQSPELRTYLAGQIARAAVVFNADEIIVYDETGMQSKTTSGEFTGVGKKGNGNVQMARILQYLECPQYLRKSFFPQHPDLKYAGLLNPLGCPHHMTERDDTPYREGVVMEVPRKEGKGSLADVGLKSYVQLDKSIQPRVRVTVKMCKASGKKAKGLVVSPSTPRTDDGLYWGYSVRLANSLSEVLTEAPYKAGYDVTIGTSEKGSSVDDYTMQPFKHLLVVFGGVQGLEASLDADQKLHVDDPSLLFDHYLNTCPKQGSNTIRTEEAVLITMSSLRSKIETTLHHKNIAQQAKHKQE